MVKQLLASIALLMVANSTRPGGVSADEVSKIGLLLSSMKEERYQHDRALIQQHADKLDYELLFESSNNDHEIQLVKAKKLKKAGVKGLILQPVDSVKAAAIVEMYAANDIPVFAYDRFIADPRVVAYISHNSYEVGVIQAKAALKAVAKPSAVLICAGQKGHNVAEEITAGNYRPLSEQNLKPIVEYHDNWSRDQCKASAVKYLKSHDINIILANNSQMAHGAIEAIESLGRHPESVFVAGSDATTQACENILSDRQDLDVYKPLTPLVEALMKVVHETLSGQRHARDHRVQHIKVGVEPVDKTSLAKFYHMDGPRCRKKEW